MSAENRINSLVWQNLAERIVEKQWGKVVLNAPMKEHTTWKIGGPAALMCWPADAPSFQKTIQTVFDAKIPFVCLGKGSNLLIEDDGLDVLVLNTGEMDQVSFQDGAIRAQGGISLSALTRRSAMMGRDLSFAAGIPGSLGGALVMNAGAHGREIAEYVQGADVLDEQGVLMRLDNKDMDFGYRSSVFQSRAWTILSVELNPPQDETETILKQIRCHTEQRRQKQPLNLPNAGSVYKNPTGTSAGALIEAAGLKGYTIGDAQVSPLHANFIVNLGQAHCQNVLELMELIEKQVLTQFGVRLQREVCFWGKKTLAQASKDLA